VISPSTLSVDMKQMIADFKAHIGMELYTENQYAAQLI
jgi:hypothetical protein